MYLRICGVHGLTARLGVLAAALFAGLLFVGYASAGPVYSSGGYVNGSTTVGATLAAQPGTWTWTGTITFGYTWQRGGATVGTGQSYTTQNADVGSQIALIVTATDDTGTVSANVGSTYDSIRWPAPVNNVAPSIKGDLKPGGTLTADVGGWYLPNQAQPGPITYRISWYGSDFSFPDHSAASVTLPGDSAGKTVYLYVNASAPSGTGNESTGYVDLNAVVGPASPPPPPSFPTNISAGQVLKGTVAWNVSGSPGLVKYYADSVYLGESTATSSKGVTANLNLDTTKLSDGAHTLGYDVYNAGQKVFASGSIPVTIANHAAPPSIVQSIAGGQTLKGTVTWTATPSAPVSQVVFALDGNKITHADATAPYEYVLDTTKLANGAHTFGLTVTLLDGSVVWQPYQVGSVTINNPNSTLPAVTQLSSTTNIKAGQVLKGTVHWTVQASGKAHAVTFYNNQVFLTQVVADGNNWAFNLDTTQFADGATKLGYDIYNAAGERVFDGTSISVTINNTGAGGGSSGGGGGSGSGGSTPTVPSTPTTPTTGSLRPTTPPALPAPKPQPNKALRLVLGGFALTPNTAIAGHTFGAAIFVVRSDTGKRITGAKIKAKATVGGKPLSLAWKGWYRTAAGATWRIPTGTTGKTFVGSLTISWRGTTLTKRFTAKVR